MHIQYDADKTAKPHSLAPGLAIRLPATATITDVELAGVACVITMRLVLMPDRSVKPNVITVATVNAADAVDGTMFRAARMKGLTREAVSAGFIRHDEPEPTPDGGLSITILSTDLDDTQRELIRLRGPVPDSLKWAAFVYNGAKAVGVSPARQVEIELGLPKSTASKWLARCRELGLIDSPERDNDGKR